MNTIFKKGQLVKRKGHHYDWIGLMDPFKIEDVLESPHGHYSLKFEGLEGYYHSNSFIIESDPNVLPEELFTL